MIDEVSERDDCYVFEHGEGGWYAHLPTGEHQEYEEPDVVRALRDAHNVIRVEPSDFLDSHTYVRLR